MKFISLSLAILAACQLAFSEKRTWTSNTGDSVEAEIIGFYGPYIFLKKGKGMNVIRFPYSQLTEECKAIASDWLISYLVESQETQYIKESDSKLSQFLDGNLVKFENGKLVPYDISSLKEPEFYAFYFSAHWCGPCRRYTPNLVGYYSAMKKIGHDNFELIFVSSDMGVGSMKKYMKEDHMPWPAIKFGKKDNRLISRLRGNGIPCLVVTDKHGHILAHSYQGNEYLGPDVPKKMLTNFLNASKRVREKIATIKKES